MRVLRLLLGLLVSLLLAACGQTAEKAATIPAVVSAAKPASFTALVRRLRRMGSPMDTLLPLPLLYRDSTYSQNRTRRKLQFELALAARPLGWRSRVVKLTEHGYPVTYSVVFQNCLVALFKSGKFGCYSLPDLTPNEKLEQQLNDGGWERCWLIDGQLVAQNHQGTYGYEAAAHAWQPYANPVPFGRHPKLYEDARYLAYATCNGEFGGTVYFYNKQTRQTHRASATCANSVWQEGGQYHVLTSLGHMMGFASDLAITNPEQLPLSSSRDSQAQVQREAAPLQVVTQVFDYSGLQLFGGFRWQNQTLYLTHWRNTTFLATIAGQRITIVDPLFADGLYTYDPVTTTYGAALALTNLNDNDLPETSELAALLWQGQQVTKIEWGKPR